MLCAKLKNSIDGTYVIQSNGSNANIIYLEQKQTTIDQPTYQYETVQHPNVPFSAHK